MQLGLGPTGSAGPWIMPKVGPVVIIPTTVTITYDGPFYSTGSTTAYISSGTEVSYVLGPVTSGG